MKPLTKAVLTLALICGLAVIGQAQGTLTYTTLTSAVTGGGGTPGSGQGTQPFQSVVTLASVTNINGFGSGVAGPQGFNPFGAIQYNTYLLIDRELMAVQTVNASTKQATVLRGWQGTSINPHNSGAIVIAGLPTQFAPIAPAGACTAAGTLVSPVIVFAESIFGNVGQQWVCDTTTGDWLPGLSTGAITPAATGAVVGTPSAQTFTLNGVIAGEPLIIEAQPTPTALCPLAVVRATAANTVTLTWYPLTAAACTPAAGTYIFFAPLHY